MSFHTAAYTILLGQTVNTDVPALTDDVLTIVNSHFLLDETRDLVYAAAMSTTLNRARIAAATFRQVTPPQIRPIIRGTSPVDDPGVADYRANPLRMPRTEEIPLEATSDLAMGTERFTALIGLQRAMEPMPAGDVWTLRGTSTTAVTANVWSTLTTTFDDTLPTGAYALVGLVHQSATSIAARLIFEDQSDRPGTLGITGLGNRSHDMFRKGRLGIWGRFNSYALPQIQVLANAADAAHNVYLDIMRMAG